MLRYVFLPHRMKNDGISALKVTKDRRETECQTGWKLKQRIEKGNEKTMEIENVKPTTSPSWTSNSCVLGKHVQNNTQHLKES